MSAARVAIMIPEIGSTTVNESLRAPLLPGESLSLIPLRRTINNRQQDLSRANTLSTAANNLFVPVACHLSRHSIMWHPHNTAERELANQRYGLDARRAK